MKSHLPLALATILLITGCDRIGKLELATREIKGPSKIELFQEVNIGNDKYILRVRDGEGNEIAKMETYFPKESIINLSPGKNYFLNDKGIRIEKK